MSVMPSGTPDLFDRVQAFVGAGQAGTVTPGELAEFEQLLRESEDAQNLYLELVEISVYLPRALAGAVADTDDDGTAAMVDDGFIADSVGSDVALQRPSRSGLPLPPAFPASGFFTTTHHGPLGFISSGWPVAYLLATVIFGIGLVIGAIVHVSPPGLYVGPPASDRTPNPQFPIPNPASIVGRITGMVDCRWAVASGQWPESTSHQPPATSHSIRLGDRLALRSGLLELTYNTGARVILQGPVTYEVESPAGGFLSIGKLTAKLEQRPEVRGQKSDSAAQKSEIANQKSFAVRTPTALVTDLGTEFGVRVDKDGNTTSHVFRGTVKMQLPEAGAENPHNTVVLGENESVETKRDPAAAKPSFRLIRNKADPRIFVRRMAPPIRSLDLRDLVAGGDGRPQRRLHEFRPSNAAEETVLVRGPEPGPCQKPRRLASADKLIDGIFVPDGSLGPVTLDSAGHRFAGFPPSSGKPFGVNRRDGALRRIEQQGNVQQRRSVGPALQRGRYLRSPSGARAVCGRPPRAIPRVGLLRRLGR